MENKFDIIKSLKEEIKESYYKLESLTKNNKQVYSTLMKIKQELDRIEESSLDNLFDGSQSVSEDETIKKLTAIRDLIKWFINRETLIRNPSQNESLNEDKDYKRRKANADRTEAIYLSLKQMK